MPDFQLGQVVATPAALLALSQAGVSAFGLLLRHLAHDWGDLDADDKAANERALREGSRLLSAYRLPTGVKVWLITEAEDDDGVRHSSTILLPSEY